MTLKLKPNTGLALNQNILLEYYYHYGVCDNPWIHRDYTYDHQSGKHIKATYLGLTRKQIIRARSSLVKRGYITEESVYKSYLLEKGIKAIEQSDYIRSGPMGPHTGVRKPPIGTLSSYIWAALRTKNIATVEELLSLTPVSEEEYDKNFQTTRRLLNWLCKAMIVRKLPQKKAGVHFNSRGHTRYQLMINLGPKHPIIRQRKHQIYDPNSQQNVAFKDVLKTFKRI
ncbi:MAG: hypothetical protein K9G26_07910 [Emcibacter sp.]|nr:hypothetical protein [Emcibacter sp.]